MVNICENIANKVGCGFVGMTEAADGCEKIVNEVSRIFVGDKLVIRKILAAVIANGHVILEDYPGVGKTLLIKALAKTLGCNYSRIQFTPDLLPSDIIGTRVWRQSAGQFELMKGPVFTNILLADEINRTPPKTQAALLEAMAERQVTIDGTRYSLEYPFCTLATQNPIDLEGTYVLPEAQLDRFMLKLSLGYSSSLEDEVTIFARRIFWQKEDPVDDMQSITTSRELCQLQKLAETAVYVDKGILDYVGRIIRATRDHPKVEIGVSPRGGLALLKLARAMAIMDGRDFITPDDIKMFLKESLAHRMTLHMDFALDEMESQDVIEEIIQKIEVPLNYSRK